MTNGTQMQQQPGFGTRLFRALGNLLIITLLLGGLAAAAIYGVPWVSDNLIKPVQDNTRQVSVLDDQVENLRGSINEAQAAQDERLTVLETNDDAQHQLVAAVEANVAGMAVDLAVEVEAREALAAELSAGLAALQASNDMLAEENAALAKDVAALQNLLADLAETTADTGKQLTAIDTQLALARVRNNLLEAQLQLLSENRGVARGLLTATVPVLTALIDDLDALEAEDRVALLNRTENAAAQIAEQPETALAEMQSVWGQLERTLNPVAVAGETS